MREIELSNVFKWTEGESCDGIILTVPECNTDIDVKYSLENIHQYLLFGNPIIYGCKGKTIDTLLNYICEKFQGWSWKRSN